MSSVVFTLVTHWIRRGCWFDEALRTQAVLLEAGFLNIFAPERCLYGPGELETEVSGSSSRFVVGFLCNRASVVSVFPCEEGCCVDELWRLDNALRSRFGKTEQRHRGHFTFKHSHWSMHSTWKLWAQALQLAQRHQMQLKQRKDSDRPLYQVLEELLLEQCSEPHTHTLLKLVLKTSRERKGYEEAREEERNYAISQRTSVTWSPRKPHWFSVSHGSHYTLHLKRNKTNSRNKEEEQILCHAVLAANHFMCMGVSKELKKKPKSSTTSTGDLGIGLEQLQLMSKVKNIASLQLYGEEQASGSSQCQYE
ncbi:hypothetical protein IGI04_004457 [Brassica rapa subsp. trilocularis]|uniref:Uncharacterized protein n=1 Tax=Brassica rapa subsp. trilocularis TaxID=1813537 RepID=A0ABQ7NB54_BRACM|nr:hypothetical protein IGI04_004457 [Brassica rapa subsp. trilocularis]